MWKSYVHVLLEKENLPCRPKTSNSESSCIQQVVKLVGKGMRTVLRTDQDSIMKHFTVIKDRHSHLLEVAIVLLAACLMPTCTEQKVTEKPADPRITQNAEPRHTYDEAVGLIKQKRYTQARDVLNTLSTDPTMSSKVQMALLICDVGDLYLKRDYIMALDRVDTAVVKGDRRWYILNVHPRDTLYSHIAALALLVRGETLIPWAEEFLRDPITDENLQFYQGTNHDRRSVIDRELCST
jgi:hypothetical protein